jgi:hypothetical protein
MLLAQPIDRPPSIRAPGERRFDILRDGSQLI